MSKLASKHAIIPIIKYRSCILLACDIRTVGAPMNMMFGRQSNQSKHLVSISKLKKMDLHWSMVCICNVSVEME